MLSRRQFIASGVTLAALSAAPRLARAKGIVAVYLGARLNKHGAAFFSGFDEAGAPAFDLALPARAHGFAQHPLRREEVVAFARRPGRFMLVVDARDGHVRHRIEASENRRFCGHGVFDAPGKLMHVTELEYDTGDGVIGVYDAADGYARVAEYRSGGLDPHEISLLPDGETLVVANGGILTDPDAPGIKLNIRDMRSSLAYIGSRDGRIRHVAQLPDKLSQLSLRHLAVAPDGLVAVVMQYEGPSSDRVPLVAFNRPGEPLRAVAFPDRVLGRLRNYCGSAAFDATGQVLATTSPVGGIAALWDRGASSCLGYVEIIDGCGLASAGDDRFIVTSGQGGAYAVTAESAAVARAPVSSQFLVDGRWDNHMLRLR
jgi:hypothetical protein